MKKMLLLVALVCCFSVLGCDKGNTIIGKWAHGSFVYTFNEDNTCSYDALGTLMKCTYKVEDNKLSILYEGNTAAFETTYTISDNKLTIKDSFGEDTVYDRK